MEPCMSSLPPSAALVGQLPVTAKPAAPRPRIYRLVRRIAIGVVLYGSAAVMTLVALPLAIVLLDPSDVLRWSNRLLDIVGAS